MVTNDALARLREILAKQGRQAEAGMARSGEHKQFNSYYRGRRNAFRSSVALLDQLTDGAHDTTVVRRCMDRGCGTLYFPPLEGDTKRCPQCRADKEKRIDKFASINEGVQEHG